MPINQNKVLNYSGRTGHHTHKYSGLLARENSIDDIGSQRILDSKQRIQNESIMSKRVRLFISSDINHGLVGLHVNNYSQSDILLPEPAVLTIATTRSAWCAIFAIDFSMLERTLASMGLTVPSAVIYD
jgi:hypothetical protein